MTTIWLAGTTTTANPIPTNGSVAEALDPAPVTIVPWPGFGITTGAFLVARVNLNFIFNTCTQLSTDLTVARQVAEILTQTALQGCPEYFMKRYGYELVKLETEFLETLNYQKNLLLCSGRGAELWGNFKTFQEASKVAWKLLSSRSKNLQHFPHATREEAKGNIPISKISKSNVTTTDDELTPLNQDSMFRPAFDLNEDNITLFSEGVTRTVVSNPLDQLSLFDLLEETRPTISRQPRSPLLIGLGIGFLGSYIFKNIFDSNDNQEISKINKNIEKNNKYIKLTNERIDMLTKNVSDAHKKIKTVLDKLVEANDRRDIYDTISWNLEQLIDSVINIKTTFRLSEVINTLLENGLLNPELIDLRSLEKIVSEGLKFFPHLQFPLEVHRYKLSHIVKIIKIHRVAHLKFLMLIPLANKARYEVFTMIPHPISISKSALALPEIKEVLFKNGEETYLLTNKDNVYTFAGENHLLLNVQPINSQFRETCEWSVFKRNINSMLKLCNFKKVGQLNDTFIVETDKHRLAYFQTKTRVQLECPEKNIRDNMVGLHKLPLTCDIRTTDTFWPAKTTIDINITDVEENSTAIDSTYLPILDINASSDVHLSLRSLIDAIPDEPDSYTIDFDYYGLTLEEIQSYTIYSQTFLTVVVALHSVIIGFLCLKWIYRKKLVHTLPSNLPDKFKDVRDSIRKRRARLRENRDSLRRHRDSIRRKGSSIKNKIITPFHSSQKEASTNTEIPLSSSNPPNYDHELYPALPRYTR